MPALGFASDTGSVWSRDTPTSPRAGRPVFDAALAESGFVAVAGRDSEAVGPRDEQDEAEKALDEEAVIVFAEVVQRDQDLTSSPA